MDERRARFLEQLRETFRAEAAEHIETMSSVLVALERASNAERPPLVEQVFREAHSLKGAARAVGLRRAEAICADLESRFAAAKNEGASLTAEHLDGVHASLGELSVICANPTAEATSAPLAPPPPATGPDDPGDAPPPAGATPADGRGADTAAAPTAGPARSTRATSGADTVRVAVKRLTGLMSDAEQLVGSRASAMALATALRQVADDMALVGSPGASSDHARALQALAATAARDAQVLAAATERILEDARSTLQLPCSSLLGTFGAIARDVARQHGKDVELRVTGEDIEVDRRVLDELKDPLIHLLRNAVDHGIETPDVRRSRGKPERASIVVGVVAAQGGRVQISVADDGAGLDTAGVLEAAVRMGIATSTPHDDADLEAAALIFESGLSSSPMVTDLSGRGLGLAIVREKVQKLNGSVSVTSSPGRGTTFTLEVPLSLSNYRGVRVAVSGRTVIIPSAAVTSVFRVRADEIRTIDGRPSVTLDGQAVPAAALHELIELPAPDQRALPAIRSAVGIRSGDRRVALLVDEVLGEGDVIFKRLGPLLERVPAVAGVSIGVGGEIVPVLDAADLVERAFGRRLRDPLAATAAAAPPDAHRILVADDSITSRSLLRSLLAGEGYAVTTAVDGEEALSRLHTEAFHLLVSDVDMPKMTGFELTAAIRADAVLGSLPVVLVTSLATPADRSRGLEAGANAYVVKSDFDSGDLLDIVRRFL